MKRAQKKFERDPRKIFFLRAKPYGLVKARNCELQSSQFNKKNKTGQKKKKSGNLMKRGQKNFELDPSKKKFHVSKTLRGAKAKNHEQSS